MFFTRFVIAALSFGSIAQVFAVPIDANLGGIDASVPAVDGSLVRGDDLTFTGAVAKATGVLAIIKGEVAALAIDPSSSVTAEFATLMGGVASALSLVSTKLESLKAAGVDKNEILLDVDGAGKTASEAVVSDMTAMYQIIDDICGSIEKLQSISMLRTDLVNMKSEIARITYDAQAFVIGAFSVVLGLDGWSNNVVAHLDKLVALA